MALPVPVDRKPQVPAPAQKERGCFQCSRRRIVCDKGEPACLKCMKKGIECSGLGRIRFAEGIARRGRFKDCKAPVMVDGLQEGCGALPTCIPSQALTWPGDRRSAKRKRRIETDEVEIPWRKRVGIDHHTLAASELATSPVDGTTQAATTETQRDEDKDIEDVIRSEGVLTQCYQSSNIVPQWIAPLEPSARMLFSYFSEAVAPAMVVLDDSANGYRSLILPMALEDDILRRAVSVVAAQHLSLKKPELKAMADAGRTAIISRLYKDSLDRPADQVFNQYTWATLIVLLVGETVTGSADFGFLVRMLLSLSTNSVFDSMGSDVMEFLQTQTHLFELLGVPLLGEEVGMLTIMKSPELLMQFLRFPDLPEESEDRIMADRLRQCFIRACAIYIRCATSPSLDSTKDLIQKNAVDQLIDLMSTIPTSFRGSHALVWVCFVAGAETTDESQRAFFVDRMMKTHARTNFRNILLAIKGLEKIWARGPTERWTLCLPRLSNVLVM